MNKTTNQSINHTQAQAPTPAPVCAPKPTPIHLRVRLYIQLHTYYTYTYVHIDTYRTEHVYDMIALLEAQEASSRNIVIWIIREVQPHSHQSSAAESLLK